MAGSRFSAVVCRISNATLLTIIGLEPSAVLDPASGTISHKIFTILTVHTFSKWHIQSDPESNGYTHIGFCTDDDFIPIYCIKLCLIL